MHNKYIKLHKCYDNVAIYTHSLSDYIGNQYVV